MDYGGEMIKLFLALALLLTGCPKASSKNFNPVEEERREKLRELMDQEDEDFDNIPEAGEEEDLADDE